MMNLPCLDLVFHCCCCWLHNSGGSGLKSVNTSWWSPSLCRMETSLDIFWSVRNMNSKEIWLTIETCRIEYSFIFHTFCDISALSLAFFFPYSWTEKSRNWERRSLEEQSQIIFLLQLTKLFNDKNPCVALLLVSFEGKGYTDNILTCGTFPYTRERVPCTKSTNSFWTVPTLFLLLSARD